MTEVGAGKRGILLGFYPRGGAIRYALNAVHVITVLTVYLCGILARLYPYYTNGPRGYSRHIASVVG
jgi:hypothetical protein